LGSEPFGVNSAIGFGGQYAKQQQRQKERKVQKLRRQRHSKEGRQGREVSEVQRDRNQEVISPGSLLRARRAAKQQRRPENALEADRNRPCLLTQSVCQLWTTALQKKTTAAAGCAD
jgi:hypothetical protein